LSQRLTVVGGRASRDAIRRQPRPAARHSTARAITRAESARLEKNNTGNSTCVAPHAEHRARLGANRARDTPRPAKPSHTTRNRAHPQGRNTPPQTGQR
jgi:hypothetical protein